MKQIQGGVTAAKGFEAAGVEAAIKYQNRKDMALIVSKARGRYVYLQRGKGGSRAVG